VLGKVLPVTNQQGLKIVVHQVYLTLYLKLFPGFQATETKVTVETATHPLKEFLIRFPCRGEEHLVVR
jgi:hypothetical protein